MSGSLYAIHFDWRSDDGPRLVGPFYSRRDATAWLVAQPFDSEADITSIWAADPGREDWTAGGDHPTAPGANVVA